MSRPASGGQTSSAQRATVSGNSGSRILRGPIAGCSMPSFAAAPRAFRRHLDQCVRCSRRAISFNSCRNRHCPKCQGNARAKWLTAFLLDCFAVPYSSSSLPHHRMDLSVWSHQEQAAAVRSPIPAAPVQRRCSGELCDPKHLGADIGFLGVLHTWGQNLEHHPHVHYISFPPAGQSRRLKMDRFLTLSPSCLCSTLRPVFPAGCRWTQLTLRPE